jgi:hypothetical protein
MCDVHLSARMARLFTLLGALGTSVVAGCAPHVDTSQLSVHIASADADPSLARDARVAEIYAAAKRHDESALLAMRDDNAKMHAPPDPALAFALFTIDSARYREDFIAAYPRTEDGVNGDYGYRLIQAHLVAKGALVPIKKLGAFAAQGDAHARSALLSALPHATGGVAAAYAAEAVHDLLAVPPATALDALAALPPDVRFAATSEIAWCERRPDRILSFVPTPAPAATQTAAPIATASAPPTPMPDALVQEQIRRSVDTCPQVAVVTPHRRTLPRARRKPQPVLRRSR